MPDRTPAVLTVEETAVELRISRGAAYAAVRAGEIPSVRIGRSLRIPRHALEALLGCSRADLYDDEPAGNRLVEKERGRDAHHAA